MGEPVKSAWCNLLYQSNGGELGPDGVPQFTRRETYNSPRGLCSKAADCAACDVMIYVLETYVAEGWAVGWECVKCLDKEHLPEGVERVLPGYYQAGRDPDSTDPWNGVLREVFARQQMKRRVVREGLLKIGVGSYDNRDGDKPWKKASIDGCTRCTWQSSFLQLVLRRERR